MYVFHYTHTHTHTHIFIHSSVSGHLGCFHILAIINGAAVNIGIPIFFQIIVLSGYMPRSRITRSYGNSYFQFFRNLRTVYIPTNM